MQYNADGQCDRINTEPVRENHQHLKVILALNTTNDVVHKVFYLRPKCCRSASNSNDNSLGEFAVGVVLSPADSDL